MELKEQLSQLVEQNLPDKDVFLVDIILRGAETNRKVIVLLDSDCGVSIADCAGLSRALAASLEENDPFPGQYTLEVSSAGLDHPLSLQRQYLSRVGKVLNLSLSSGEQILGELLEVAKEEIVVDRILEEKKKQKTEETHVPFSEIEKAMVQVSFK